ncbi:MAG: HD domain-containing protein [Zoogloeaceae bacterium]|nr:HD domain-containing protein [Zoogloeaceae bacterium]
MTESATQNIHADVALQERDMALTVVASLIDSNGNPQSKALLRKQALIAALARKLQKDAVFAPLLPDDEVRLMVRASVLQNIGKSDVPDKVLLKPGRLTEQEFALVKRYPDVGYEALKEAERLMGQPSAFLAHAQDMARNHQEKWDGSGYPRQLRGDAIPLSARISSIIEVYNAITSHRVYKAALPHAGAIKIIRELRGQSFDPRIVDAFLSISPEIEQLARKYADHFDQQAEIERLASSAAEEITL